MTSYTLVEQLAELTLSPSRPELSACLPFRPTGHHAHLQARLSDVSRYLFRISSPLSDATTDGSWVRSKDAKLGLQSATRDLFEDTDGPTTAAMLDRHLRWRGQPQDHDNLVSWTSSLLFALQYVFYRHFHEKDGSSLEHIRLCVVDTTALPQGVFIQDIDLINTFKKFDRNLSSNSGLQNLYQLRTTTRTTGGRGGAYYFGEYLSQGALRIAGCSQIVSAQSLINSGVFIMRPEFGTFMTGRQASWANQVMQCRQSFQQLSSPKLSTISQVESEAALRLAELLSPGWRLPFAANLVALKPRDPHDEKLLRMFQSAIFTDEERRQCSSTGTRVVADSNLPEVELCARILQAVNLDFHLSSMIDCLRQAEVQLRHAHLSRMSYLSEYQGDQQSDRHHERVSARLRRITYLARTLDLNSLEGQEQGSNHVD